jgi:Bacterial dipeptidyl-peptidase Sh3 domain
MDNLIAGATGAKRPLFVFSGHQDLPEPSRASAIPTGQFSLSGPSVKLDAPHWPVRGDLAHVRLAGQVFVPHYAVPMERTIVASGSQLLAEPKADSEVRAELAGGSAFNVLDLTGDWAWGQIGEDGFVGYLPAAALAERRS